MIYLGADHAGFKLKEHLKKYLKRKKIKFTDLSPKLKRGDDYPDVTRRVGHKIVRASE